MESPAAPSPALRDPIARILESIGIASKSTLARTAFYHDAAASEAAFLVFLQGKLPASRFPFDQEKDHDQEHEEEDLILTAPALSSEDNQPTRKPL